MSAKKWKSNLLSSSLPLEFQVAKLLVDKSFFVGADYPYTRCHDGVEKEFTVDIRGSCYYIGPRQSLRCPLDMLVECKHRLGNVAWLFLPDPHRQYVEMSDPVATGGSAVSSVAAFSRLFFHLSPREFEPEMAQCYKGVEIDLGTGKVYDAELRHGVAQLQYALPSLAATLIRTAAGPPILDRVPFYFVGVLMTNARLFVAHDDLSLSSVSAASAMNDLAENVPYVALRLAEGPGFRNHATEVFTDIDKVITSNEISEIEAFRSNFKYAETPGSVVAELRRGRAGGGIQFHKIIVCDIQYVDELITKLQHIAVALTKNLKSKP